MAKFMLILHETPGAGPMSAEDVQQIIEKYRAWGARLRAEGKIHAGNKLKEESGKVVTAQNGRVSVVDGPYSETKEVVGGYYLIEAADYAEAVELARGCPHVHYGRIEVRQVDLV
jgi:hypothetical protein